MTTSINAETTETTIEKIEPRSIDELYKTPLSEMTEEELENFTNYKASLIAKDENYKLQLNAIIETGEKLYNEMKEQNEKALNIQEQLLDASLKRLKNSEELL